MHVWHVRLNPGERCLRRAWLLLDAQERERACRLRSRDLRHSFIAAHAAMRGILATSLGCHPLELRFTRSAGGKPALVGPSPLNFNLSHARHDALVAVDAHAPVGIDLEDWPGPEHPPLEPRDLSPILGHEEHAGLLRLAPAQRPLECLRLWVRKEAVLKAQGSGLSEDARLIGIPVPAPHRATIGSSGKAWLRPGGSDGDEARWSVTGLERPGRWLAAVARAGTMPAPRLHAWTWTPP